MSTFRCIFVTIGSFPYGKAATNRLLSYSRGLAELGHDVYIIVLSPDYNQSALSNRKKIKFNNINIVYTSPFLFVKNNLFGKINFIFGVILGFFYLTLLLMKSNKSPRVTLIFEKTYILMPYIKLVKFFNGKVFHERTEFPYLNKKSDFLYNLYIKNTIPLFDGIYVISFLLVEFFKTLTIKPVLHLPMTVEFDRFNLGLNREKKYIAYCGSMYTDKDGVPDLIESFNMFSKENKEIFLYLIGDNSDKKKFKIISDKIDISPVKHRIICTGNVERDKMPELLKNAIMLLLCRPDNLQAQGGFPTKLGEYLATANPVVITDVGDHGRYLKDRVSAFIARPGDPYSFASKMEECLNDPVLAESVGKNGYDVAMQHFNYKTQAVILSNFFEGNL